MNKILFLTAFASIVLCGATSSYAEDTLPPLPVPVLDESTTPGPEESVVVAPYIAPSPSPTPSPQRSVAVTNFSSEAETGSKLYVLLAVSALGGFGLFCIKKYLDSRHYSL